MFKYSMKFLSLIIFTFPPTLILLRNTLPSCSYRDVSQMEVSECQHSTAQQHCPEQGGGDYRAV